ncbi:MAG: nitric oxide reductase transcriptional regulator NorR [Planctomycetes bacterium]|nr:nitric oxide reductase transcriptional regulator NorR [Planctomycetota bacterium]
MTEAPTDPLLAIALDMTTSLSAEDRAQRLVRAVQRAVPCDAVALLRTRGDELVPIAQIGLSPDLLGRRFGLADHPRLAQICAAADPIVFAGDSALPDPFDGMLRAAADPSHRVHACLGCALRVDGELVGALTADALDSRSFDHVDRRLLAHLGALAGAALRTMLMIEALEQRAAREDLVARDLVRDALEQRGGLLLGSSAPMRELRQEIELFAGADMPVLVTGETGVGKELVVRRLHSRSRRADQPLIYVNCAALPESIAESELFGHVKGAFTGADTARPGKFGVADGASLFLDEVGELPLHIQPKLLRVLQEGELQRVGEDRPRQVDVRVLAATNRNLDAEVAAGRFRADLLHRLDVGRIRVPPLRDHAEDVPQLAGHFADEVRRRLGCGSVRFVPPALDRLMLGDWPGNVRELENVVSRAILRAAARTKTNERVLVTVGDLDVAPAAAAPTAAAPSPARELSATPPHLRESVDAHQRARIQDAVARHGGNWAAAARELGLARANLHRLAQRLGLK